MRPPQVGMYSPQPSPNPANTETFAYGTTQMQRVATGQSYNGVSNAYAVTTIENDRLNGALSSRTSTATEYFSSTPSGSSQLINDLGGTLLTSGNETVATTYGSNAPLVDVLPEMAGTLPASQDATATRNETDSDGRTQSRTTNADGTYTEKIVDVYGSNSNAMQSADGSGTYSVATLVPTNILFTIGPPTLGTGGYVIALSIAYPPGVIATTASTQQQTVPVWYPLPYTPYATSLVDRGQTAIPAACNVPASLMRSTSNALVATTSTVDAIFGELDTTVTTEYTDPGVGIACVVSSDVVQQFYDFSQQAGLPIQVSGTPVQTTTTTQTLGITTETVIGTSSRTRGAFFAAARARFAATLERATTARHAATTRALRATHATWRRGRR